MVFFPQASPPEPCAHISPPLYAPKYILVVLLFKGRQSFLTAFFSLCWRKWGKYKRKTETTKIHGWNNENCKRRLENCRQQVVNRWNSAVPGINPENERWKTGTVPNSPSPFKATFSRRGTEIISRLLRRFWRQIPWSDGISLQVFKIEFKIE